MHEITIKHRDGHRTYKVFTKEEADEEGIEYVYWKEAYPGDWAITDDNYVMLCYQRYETKGNDQVVLAGGRSWTTEDSVINHDEYRKVGNYCYNKPQTWSEVEARKSRMDRALTVLAASLLATGEYDYEAAAQAYRKDQEIPVATLKRNLKQKEVKIKLEKKLIELYNERGFTKDWVVDKILKAAEIAEDKNDVTNLLRAAENGIKLHAMEPKKKQRTDELEMDFSKEISDGIQKEKKRITARRTTEEDDDEEMDPIPEHTEAGDILRPADDETAE